MDLAQERYEDKSICLHHFGADETEVICEKLSKDQIKKLCLMCNKWDSTPFHTASKEAIEVLCHYLDKDDIREIDEIKNAWKLKPSEIKQIPGL